MAVTQLAICQIAEKEIPIIPKPASIKLFNGKCAIGSNTSIYYTKGDLQFSAEFVADIIKSFGGESPEVIYSSKPPSKNGIIQLVLDKTISEKEGYRLTSGKNIVISGQTPQGVFYGVQSLLQLLYGYKTNTGFSIPCMNITDSPRFPWRGMHLDVSRHFFDKEFIKKYIDILALHKMNTFHWHLVDDQGWRIEIKKYPKLTDVGAWRVNHEDLPWNNRPAQKPGEKATYGGFYTQEDIKEIVSYASQRYINVVPEIEMPAHVTCAIAAYPQLSCKQIPVTVPSGGFWPITDIYCAGNDSTFLFLQDVLTEVMALFPSKYIHVGGDEADKTNWKTCPKCQARIKGEGLKDVGELQNYFISRIDKFLTSKGRTLIGWDEILEGGLAENATVMSWRGIDGGIQAARMKHDVVMTPSSHCYFDYYQSTDKEIEPAAFGGLIDFKKVYSYEPVPQELNVDEAKHVLGAQGNMWSEFLLSNSQVEYMAIPRITALSEVVWTPASLKSEASFLARLQNMYTVLQAQNINFHVPTPQGLLKTMLFIDTALVELSNPLTFGQIYYTTDGSVPTTKSAKYTTPFKVTSNTTLKALLVLDNGKASGVKSGELIQQKPRAALTDINNLEPGIRYDLFEGGLTTLANLKLLPLKNTGKVNEIKIPANINFDLKALAFNGFIQLSETGVYTFKLISDDGSQLFIDDQLVIDHDGPHGPEPKEGQIALMKGLHRIKVLFFQAGGGETLQLLMKTKGIEEQPVNASILFRTKD